MSAFTDIVGFVRSVNDRKKTHAIDDQLQNYLTSPDATIKAVNTIDPRFAIALSQQHQTEDADAQKRAADQTALATGYLRGLPAGSDYGSAIDGMTPMLTNSLGMSPDEVLNWRKAITANPAMITSLDDAANKARANSQYGTRTVAPGATVMTGDKVTYRAPFAPQVKTIRRADGGTDLVPFDPNSGSIAGGAGYTEPAPAGAPGAGGGGGPLTVDRMLPLTVAQESGGDYTAVNKTTGALGRYQVMPTTGQKLAQGLGMPWRPDMMRGDDQASRNYQDAIGKAAAGEAVSASGGDPAAAFSYYYSGSPTAYRDAKGNPKTAKYVADMMARLGGGAPGGRAAPAPGGAPAPAGGAIYSTPGKPQIRSATPEELAGYPAGTMAQIDATGKLVNIRTPTAGAANLQQRQQANYAKVATMVEGTVASLDQLRESVAGILNNPDLDSYVGNISGRLPGFLSSGRNDFNQNLDTLKTQVGMTALANMRAQSPTGGALGQVSNYENKMLQRSLANLDASQSPEQFRKNLGVVLTTIDRAKRRMGDALARTPGGQAGGGGPPAPASNSSPPMIGATIKNKSTGEVRVWNGRGWVAQRGNR